MNHPTTGVVTHTGSTTRQRLRNRHAPGLNVSSTTPDVLAVGRTTDTPVVRRRAIPRHDPHRSITGCMSESLEDLDERGVRADEGSVIVLPEL